MNTSSPSPGGQAAAMVFISSMVSSRGSTTVSAGSLCRMRSSAAGNVTFARVDQITSPAKPVWRTSGAMARSWTMTASGCTSRCSCPRSRPASSNSSDLIRVLNVTKTRVPFAWASAVSAASSPRVKFLASMRAENDFSPQ